MFRVFLSTVIGVIAGILLGVGLGWYFPAEYRDSELSELATVHQDNYTVMIAAGYVRDGDIQGALGRLQLLDVENVPLYVQDMTERYITNSRDLDDIQLLVALSDGFGRLTPVMQPYCQLCRGDS